jgi:hypothetical protein
MEMQQIQTTIIVFGKKCEVAVLRYQNGTWRALGSYEGHPIEGSPAKTHQQAIKNWKRSAEYHADFENFVDRL